MTTQILGVALQAYQIASWVPPSDPPHMYRSVAVENREPWNDPTPGIVEAGIVQLFPSGIKALASTFKSGIKVIESTKR